MRTMILVDASLMLLLICGCTQQTVSIETEIASDGTLSRAIQQPADETLPESSRLGWTSAEVVSEPSAERNGPTFHGSGTFDNVSSIPNHFNFPSADGSVSGGLKRGYTRTDYGFFVEHFWTEEMTDPIHAEDFPEAAKKLTAFVSDFCTQGLREFLGKELDVSLMADWINQDGSEIVLALALANMHARGRERNLFGDEGIKVMQRIGKKHGIEIDDNVSQSIERFLRRELPQRIRYADGKPIEAHHLESIFYALSTETIDGKPNPCGDAFKRVIERDYGDKEFEQKPGLLTPLVGVYADRLWPNPLFKFALKFPGLITKTNGLIVDDSRVEWEFHAADASIFGYKMFCRSVERTDSACDELLPKKAVRHRRDMIDIIEIAKQDDSIRQALVAVSLKQKPISELPKELADFLMKQSPDRRP